MDARVAVYALVVFITAIFQQSSLFLWAGVKANVLLLVILAYAFFVRTIFEYCFVLFAAIVGLFINVRFDWSIGAFIIVGFGIYFACRILPWQSWFSYGTLLIAGTLLFYVLVDWRLVVEMPVFVLQELVYNCVLGIVVYWLAVRFYEKQSGRKF